MKDLLITSCHKANGRKAGWLVGVKADVDQAEIQAFCEEF